MNIPLRLQAGDTWEWTDSLPDYPAPTWVLKYALHKTGIAAIVLTAVASGTDHKVTVTAATTAGYGAGEYHWAAYVEHADGRRYTVAQGWITVKPSLAAAVAATDNRSHAQQALEAIEATMKGRATKAQSAMQINNRQIQYLKPEELIRWRSFYKAEVAREKAAEKIAQGEDPGRRILTRFKDDASRGAWPLNRAWRWPW